MKNLQMHMHAQYILFFKHLFIMYYFDAKMAHGCHPHMVILENRSFKNIVSIKFMTFIDKQLCYRELWTSAN